MEVVLGLAIGAALYFLIMFLHDRFSFEASYDRAMRKDMEYFRAHPDCTYEEAHRNRDKVYRRNGM